MGLLRYVGCPADAAGVAHFAGDEIALAVAAGPFVMGEAAQEQRAVGVAGVERAKAAAMAAHREAAGLLLVGRLQLGDNVVAAVRHGFERWGRGGASGRAAW